MKKKQKSTGGKPQSEPDKDLTNEDGEAKAAKALLQIAAEMRTRNPCLHGQLTVTLVYVDGWLNRFVTAPQFSEKVDKISPT